MYIQRFNACLVILVAAAAIVFKLKGYMIYAVFFPQYGLKLFGDFICIGNKYIFRIYMRFKTDAFC